MEGTGVAIVGVRKMFESNFWIKGEDDIGLGDENELALSLSSVLGDF